MANFAIYKILKSSRNAASKKKQAYGELAPIIERSCKLALYKRRKDFFTDVKFLQVQTYGRHMFFLKYGERHRIPHMKRGKEYRIPHVKEVESLAPIPYVFFGAEKKVLKKKFFNTR